MNSFRCSMILGLSVLSAVASPSRGQRPPNEQGTPHIGYVFPAGGQRGTALQVVEGGKFLDAGIDPAASLPNPQGLEVRGMPAPADGLPLAGLLKKTI